MSPTCDTPSVHSLVPLVKRVKVVAGDHVSDENITLCIKEKHLSLYGGSFPVINATTGQPALQVHGPPITLHDKKSFYSADGKDQLFQVRYHSSETPYFVGERQDIIDPSVMYGDPHPPVFVVKKTKRDDKGITMTAQIGIPSAETGRSTAGPKLGLHGPFDSENGSPIVDMATGQPVALIHRKSHDVMGKVALAASPETYFVTVAPGMDYAVIAGVAVCFDELHNEKSHTHA